MSARVLTIGKIGVAYGAMPRTEIERRVNTTGYSMNTTRSGFFPTNMPPRGPDSTAYPRPRGARNPTPHAVVGQRMGRIGLTFAPGQGDTSGGSSSTGSPDGLSGGLQDVFGPGTQDVVSFSGGGTDTGPVQGSGGGASSGGGTTPTDSSGGLSGGLQDVFGPGTQEGVTFSGGQTDSTGGTTGAGGGGTAPQSAGGGGLAPQGGGNLPTPVVVTQSGLSTKKILLVGGVVAALAAIVIWRPQWLGLRKHNPSKHRRGKRRRRRG